MAEIDKDDLISIIEEDDHRADLPKSLPLLPVRDVVIFTDMLLPLMIGRDRSIAAVDEAVAKGGFILMVTQKDPAIENPTADDIYEIGTVGRVLRMLKMPDGKVKVLAQGIAKAKIARYLRKRGFYRVSIALLEEIEPAEVDLETEALMRNVREHAEKILAIRGELTGDIGAILHNIDQPGRLADLIASNLRLKIDEAQALLELTDPLTRLQKINDLLGHELQLSTMQAKIQSNVKDEISKNQRDYFLREQVRAIYRELGEQDERTLEINEYRTKIKRAKLPKTAKS